MSYRDSASGLLNFDTDELILTVLDNMIWPILILVGLGVLVAVPQTLLTAGSIKLILWGGSSLGLFILAESICLLSDHFDLSIGAIAGVSSMLTGLMLGTCPHCWHVVSNPWIGFAIILLVGVAIGLFNGIMIGKFNINPFLQTLSSYIIFFGARLALSTSPATGMGPLFMSPGGSPDFSIGLLIAIFLIAAFVLRYTDFGQAIYATGSDGEAAREVGINTELVTISVYTISGFLSALAGLLTVGYVGMVPPGLGTQIVFLAFAGSVIGGVNLFGGRGKVTGAFGGFLLMQLIQAALNNSTLVGATEIRLVNGIVLFIAILLYSTKERIRERVIAVN